MSLQYPYLAFFSKMLEIRICHILQRRARADHLPRPAAADLLMHACMCTRVRVYASTLLCECTRVHTRARVYACTRVRVYACTRVCVFMYACTHLRECTRVYMRAGVQACMRVYACTRECTCWVFRDVVFQDVRFKILV